MTNAIIGYENKLGIGTLTAESEAAGAPKENAINWRLEDYWQPSSAGVDCWLEVDMGAAVSVDYLAFYSSDLFAQDGAQVRLRAGATPAPSTVITTLTPRARGPKLQVFTSASHRYWRITFSQTGSYVPKIQLASIGARLELEQGLRPGYTPPALGNRNAPINSVSRGGLFIGRSVEVAPVDFSLITSVLTPVWVRANWPDLLTHIEQYPFFLLPEPDDYDEEAVLAWTKGIIKPPAYTHSNFMSLQLALSAFV